MSLENRSSKIEHIQNDRKSVKSCSTNSEIEIYSPIPNHPHSVVSNTFRFQLFEASEQGILISQKVSQRAVSWLLAICWSKNLSQQCLWLSVLLFYSCKVKRRIKKEDLQLTLLTCLSLSMKMLENQYYSPKTLAGLSTKLVTATDIISMEEKILEMVDYNLVIPHQLSQIMFSTTLQEEKFHQVLMICDLLIMKDHEIFMNHSKLDFILKIVRRQALQGSNQKQMFSEIKDLLQLKQCKIIVHKYSSKIDIEVVKNMFD